MINEAMKEGLKNIGISSALVYVCVWLGVQSAYHGQNMETIVTYNSEGSHPVEVIIEPNLMKKGSKKGFLIKCRYKTNLSPESIFAWHWVPWSPTYRKSMAVPIAGVNMDKNPVVWRIYDNIHVTIKKTLAKHSDWSEIMISVTKPMKEQFGSYRCQVESKKQDGNVQTLVSTEQEVWAKDDEGSS